MVRQWRINMLHVGASQSQKGSIRNEYRRKCLQCSHTVTVDVLLLKPFCAPGLQLLRAGSRFIHTFLSVSISPFISLVSTNSTNFNH